MSLNYNYNYHHNHYQCHYNNYQYNNYNNYIFRREVYMAASTDEEAGTAKPVFRILFNWKESTFICLSIFQNVLFKF